MKTSFVLRIIWAAPVCLGLAAPGFAQKQPHDFLKSVGGFDDGALSKLDSGDVITVTLDTGVSNELALMGAARMDGTIEAFLPLYRDIERFEAGMGLAKKLSSPPKLSDFDTLELAKSEFKALSNCKPEDCAIHLSQEGLDELRSQIDWSDPNASDAVLRFVRQRLLGFATAYEEGGNAALSVYRNRQEPRAVAGEFEKLLDNSPYILRYEPELHRYLLDYPKATLAGSSGFLYWSVIGFGPNPTLRLNHVTIYPTGEGANATTIITSKQLYYSRYFDTGLELYTLVPDDAQPGAGFYLVALNRYRTDFGEGLMAKIMSKGAAWGTEDAMRKTIANAQAAVKKPGVND